MGCLYHVSVHATKLLLRLKIQQILFSRTEHAAWHFKRGTVYYPGKMCGYNMIVWRGTTASSGDCDIINGQAVVDWNINNHPPHLSLFQEGLHSHPTQIAGHEKARSSQADVRLFISASKPLFDLQKLERTLALSAIKS